MNRLWVALLVLPLLGSAALADEVRTDRPNILWITCEDISPNLGCYGDGYAVTPNLDRLATQGVRYTHAFAPIGVCAPSRSSLITGMFAPSIGTHPMRCQGTLPDSVRCFPEHLRNAGYYCTNNVKTDYNFVHRKETWDESSNKAHWRGRKDGQPFFAVFNFTSCHESQIRLAEKQYTERTRDFTDRERHDPAKAVLPPYHPDAPEVRKDWARYADMITFMDKQAGKVLKELEDDGLAEDTVVFYFSDHGAGMPRSKRWLYDSSTRVPFIVRFPKKYADAAPGKPGTMTDRLVNFVDFGPTVLSLAGIQPPDVMQGKPFLGKHSAAPRQYVQGFRDRMDERYDMVRSVRDRKYKYIRNYLPHLPWFHEQYVSYMYEMPTMKVWQRLADEGKLTGPAATFMARSKPTEELYETEADPHEVKNLATSKAHRDTLERLRKAHRDWMKDIIDLGLLPESDLRTRFGGRPEYEAVRRDPKLYPFERIAAAADLAGAREPSARPKLVELLKDDDPAVRYWAAVGLGALGADGKPSVDDLRKSLRDTSATVRVAAADALCRVGELEQGVSGLIEGIKDDNPWVRLAAVNHLDRLGDRAKAARDVLEKARADKNQYVVRVVEHALGKK
jgi:N-sulfoglucosamine sulfohydrolase